MRENVHGGVQLCCYCNPGLLEMEAGTPGRLKKVSGMMLWTDRLVRHNLHAHSWEGMPILPSKDIALWGACNRIRHPLGPECMMSGLAGAAAPGKNLPCATS